MRHETQSKQAAQDLMSTQDVMTGLPQRGRNVGPGQGVPIADTWDGEGDPPIGWTSHRASVALLEGAKRWSCDVLSVDKAARIKLLSKVGEADVKALEDAFEEVPRPVPKKEKAKVGKL